MQMLRPDLHLAPESIVLLLLGGSFLFLLTAAGTGNLGGRIGTRLQVTHELAHAAPDHVELGPPFREAVLVLVAVVEAVQDAQSRPEEVYGLLEWGGHLVTCHSAISSCDILSLGCGT